MKCKISSDDYSSSPKPQKTAKLGGGRDISGTQPGSSGSNLTPRYPLRNKTSAASQETHSDTPSGAGTEPKANNLDEARYNTRKRKSAALEEDQSGMLFTPEKKPPALLGLNPSPRAGDRKKKTAVRRSQKYDPVVSQVTAGFDHLSSADGERLEPSAKKTKTRHSQSPRSVPPKERVTALKPDPKPFLEKLPREIRNLIYSEVLGSNRRVRRVQAWTAPYQREADADFDRSVRIKAQLELERQKEQEGKRPSRHRKCTIQRLVKENLICDRDGEEPPIRMLETAIFLTNRTVYEEARSTFLEGNHVHILPTSTRHASFYGPEETRLDEATRCQLLQARKMTIVCNANMLPLIAATLTEREVQPMELHIRLSDVIHSASHCDFVAWTRSLLRVRARICTFQICETEIWADCLAAGTLTQHVELCERFKGTIDDIVGVIESRLRVHVEEIRLTTTAI